MVLAFSSEPASTANFSRGAEAEIRVARYLTRRCGPEVELLFNRRLSRRGRSGDIDVLAVTPSGVHIVDVKRYQGAKVRIRRTGGLIQPMKEQLLIRGRDQTRLLVSVSQQEQVVRALMSQLPNHAHIQLSTALCFVDADLPLLPEKIAGTAMLGRRTLVRRLNRPGHLDVETRERLVRHLAHHLPPA